MTLTRRPLLIAGAACLAMPALGQTRRPLRIVVPFPPGGSVDSLGRVLADRLAPVLEQTVVVENRSGGAGLIGADAVAKSAPDGTMLGIIGAATLCAAPYLLPSMPFDVTRDFRAVTQITDSAVVLAVNEAVAASRGWTDMAAMVAWARANPGAVRIGHAGPATVSHLTLSAICTTLGIDITGVGYRGGAQQATDVLAGTVEGSADLPGPLLPLIESRRVRAMGQSAGTRLRLLSHIPALAETPGLESLDIRSWNMLMVAPATPEAEVARLHAAIRQVAATPAFAAALRPLGYDPVVNDSPAAAAELVRSETPRWRRLVEISGAKVE